ncbi:uncharacterized protein [Leuresthes tenuis]|uniref:uncharacterized protein isoform X2 n=1 Tax=Leuresthes tenuis TaxID=355514 RepID=UPI003B510088
MSGEKATSPCNKFQANIFNKSKCQNCFKSRELHLLSDHDMEQAKPIYGGWLCLAPVGTDFDNPMQRSRKWQRRFFILYEHGSLSYALDELPSTLPQGTVNMNLCTDITDAEPRTGQRNALCFVTPEQKIFIRGDSKEIINGWSEQLAVYLRTNKQNQKKKRKVEPVANQEPSPAKMAATDLSFPPSEEDSTELGQWKEEQRAGGSDETPVWTDTNADPPGNTNSHLCPVSSGSLTCTDSFGSPVSSPDDSAVSTNTCSNNQLAETNNIQTTANNQNQGEDRSSAERLLGLEATRKEHRGGTTVSRQGRTEARTSKREKLQSCADMAQLDALPPQRRAKSLDRRTSDTVMTPDLLNFKKGWMVKLDENDQWKKYWFVLSTDSLRYYRDSLAEEASDLEGEIDLTKCYNVSEYPVQRNYGFQIHTLKGVFTLSAMTAGIRKNWIEALMKNVHPANAPDVASLSGHHVSCSPPEVLPKPDVTQDSASSVVPTERDPHPKPRSVKERRQEGHYKTFDWAEFTPQTKLTVDAETQETKPLRSLELDDLERRRRREERRKKYESMLGFSLGQEESSEKMVGSTVRALSPKSQQRVEEEMEKCWKQVEMAMFRVERTVPLPTEARNTAEVEEMLHSYRKGVEDLKVQLAESERCRLKLEAQLSADGFNLQQLELPLCSEADLCTADMNKKPVKGLKDSYKTTELFQQQHIRQDVKEKLHLKSSSAEPQLPIISLQELEDFIPETTDTFLVSPASDSQHELSPTDGPGLNFDDTTTHPWNQLGRGDCQLFSSSETKIHSSDFFSLENPVGRDDSTPTHVAPDQLLLKRLSQDVEMLTSQNEALNQHNQEMLNQLTEADREIERLKAELSSRYTEPHHLPEVEQQGKMRLEDLEKELSSKNQQLLDAQALITSLEENLREAEVLLQLKNQVETKGPEDENKNSAEKTEGYLLRCFEATEAKLTELERQLKQSELTCRELQQQNAELKEEGKLCSQRAAEADAEIRRLHEECQRDRLNKEERNGSVSGEEKLQKVIEGMVTRLRALGKLLEVFDGLGFVKETEEEEKSPAVVSQLRWEEELWSLLSNKLKDDPSQMKEPVDVLMGKVTECLMLEKQMLLAGHDLLLHTEEVRGGVTGRCESKAEEDLDFMCNSESFTAAESTKTNGSSLLPFDKQLCEMENLKVVTQMNISLLNQISSISASELDRLQPAADRLYDFLVSEHPCSASVFHSVATEALYCYRLNRLQSRHKRELCCNCVSLMEENQQLKARLSDLEEKQVASLGAMITTCCQIEERCHHDTDTELQSTEGSPAQEMETCPSGAQKLSDGLSEKMDEEDQNIETKQISYLKRKVKELEEQLSALADKMKEEFDEKMSAVQEQHETEMEQLKAACERGFVSMEESHLKVVDELQRVHQQEVERLLMEKDRLLEEESTATVTAIEAIKSAYRVELQRELQRRRQPENENAQMEDVHRHHREELDSYQRELDVLSQQFSLKCLENRHLVQALDAERKGLCQCQLENQDLRSRNQELSGHLAAEITRLCSLAKQDALPLSQRMGVYEMEITLRVKESEVQCLKQKITSLKDELQSSLKDKRNATKKYKDVYTELSIVRAKADREAEELRENLRLAHEALGQTSA